MEQAPKHYSEQVNTVEHSPLDAEAKARFNKKFSGGLQWLCAGVALMGFSFLINFVMYHMSQSFELSMYALTSAGSLCIMKSLWNLFGG